MNLISVYKRPELWLTLFSLLGERTKGQSISHKKMPTWKQHVAFIKSKPYRAWYAIRIGELFVGSCYLTHQNEIGVSIFRAHQGRDYGPDAVKRLMKRHGKRRYLANINPNNGRSIAMFKKLGFGLIQHTYERI